MDKEGFVVYKSFYEPIKELSLEHKGLLLAAIFEYQLNKSVIDLPAECRMAFKFFKNQFDLDDKKYAKTCEKRALAGSKGGKQKQANLANVANASKSSKSKKNVANLANVADKEKEKEKEKDLNIDTLKTEYLTNNNILKKENSKNLESEQFSVSVDLGKQILIGADFKINFSDEFFNPYRHASSDLARSIEDWFVKNKLGCRVDKNFICRQITNFAKKQGKYNELLGIASE